MKRLKSFFVVFLASASFALCLQQYMLKASMSALRVVFVTTPSDEVASKIGRAIVENKLAACVNIVPGIKSIYDWGGRIHEDAEHLMIIKTTEEAIPRLRERILSIHPYDVPEFVAVPVSEESERYAEWVRAQSQPRSE